MITPPQKNWLEWSVFAVGLALLLAIVGYLVARALGDGSEPAALHVEVGEAWSPPDAPALHVVSVTVRNNGGRSAAEVDVEVVLPGEPPERRELTFDHGAQYFWVDDERFARVARAWWDSHGQNFETHQEMVPELDHVMAALIDDLGDRLFG